MMLKMQNLNLGCKSDANKKMDLMRHLINDANWKLKWNKIKVM